MTGKIDASELVEFAVELGAVDAKAARVIDAAMTKCLIVLEQAVVIESPAGATGNFKGATTHEKSGNPLGVFRGEVFNLLKYGIFVEKGRQPGRQPPTDAIKLWVIRKLGVTGKDADTAAYLIARAIGRRGTKAQRPFEKGFDRVLPAMIRIWEQVPDDIVRLLP